MDEYFEDVEVGQTASFGSYDVTKAEIVEFGERYDPQPFHVDEAAASESMFGELVASGWHTASMTMRMLVDGYLGDSRALGALGVDELRFRKPVRPGDALSVEAEVIDTEVWDEDRGVVHNHTTTTNQDDETVVTMTGLVLWERR